MLQKASRSEGQAFCSVIAESNFPGMSQPGLLAIRFSAKQQQVQFYLLGKAVTCLKSSSSYSLVRLGTPTKSGFFFFHYFLLSSQIYICLYEWPHSRFHLPSVVEV